MASFTDKVKAQVDKVLHPGENKDTIATGSTATGTSHTGHSHTGTGVGTGVGAGTGSTNAGPHSSNLANKADPRVDSDLDRSRNMGAAGLGGHSATAGTDYNDPRSTNLGPHSTNTANKLDPRVDSDGDRGLGATGRHTGTGLTGTSGIGGTTHHTGTGVGGGPGPAPNTAGPHSSDMLNKADPRVDSDMDRSRGTAGGLGATGGLGSTGHHAGTGVGGTGVGGTGHHAGAGVGGGPGPAPNTAGPHSSDMLNKADPRVDSDMDGSKTVGGNATY